LTLCYPEKGWQKDKLTADERRSSFAKAMEDRWTIARQKAARLGRGTKDEKAVMNYE